MVDTGASLVVLRASAAAEVGIRPMPTDYTATVSTANGTIKAAPAKLDRVEIGDITVFDVPALVLPDEALAQNLLGVSFLSRLKRYEDANGKHGAGAVGVCLFRANNCLYGIALRAFWR